MRQVPTREGAAYAARKGTLFVEASAKTAVGLREVFRDTVERVLDSESPFHLAPHPNPHFPHSDPMTEESINKDH